MGCNESKQKVAAGNTITRKKSSRANSRVNEDSVKSRGKDIETVIETSNNNGENRENLKTEQRQEGGQILNSFGSKNNDDDDERVANITNMVAAADNDYNGNDNLEVEENVICKDSPNHFFSSRKNEEVIEGINVASSEKSEYDSPRVNLSERGSLFDGSVKVDVDLDDENVIVSAKNSFFDGSMKDVDFTPALEEDEKVVEEAEQKSDKGEIETSIVKEAEKEITEEQVSDTCYADEPKSSNTGSAEEQKSLTAEVKNEQSLLDSLAKDEKTN